MKTSSVCERDREDQFEKQEFENHRSSDFQEIITNFRD